MTPVVNGISKTPAADTTLYASLSENLSQKANS